MLMVKQAPHVQKPTTAFADDGARYGKILCSLRWATAFSLNDGDALCLLIRTYGNRLTIPFKEFREPGIVVYQGGSLTSELYLLLNLLDACSLLYQ
jgi:hypothetical protein